MRMRKGIDILKERREKEEKTWKGIMWKRMRIGRRVWMVARVYINRDLQTTWESIKWR